MYEIRPAGMLLLLAAHLLAASAAGAYAAAERMGAGARIHTASASPGHLEDDVPPELSWAPSLMALMEEGISTGALDPKRPTCPRNGPCSDPGAPYIGRGCKDVYHCPKSGVEEVPPELGWGSCLGQSHISPLQAGRQLCTDQCAAEGPGDGNIPPRPCNYIDQCRSAGPS